MRQPKLRGNASGDPDRPVDSRRDQPVDPLRFGQPLDAVLVLGRDDRATVRVPEAGRIGIAVDGDDVQVALARGGEQPELRRPRA